MAVVSAVAALGFVTPEAQSAELTPKVLVIGLDGVNWAKVVAANAPTLDNLAATGTLAESLLYCGDVAESKSAPGWSTIASGVWPDKHGVKNNSFSGKQYSKFPDFLTRLEQHDPSISTLSIVDWDELHTQGTFGPAIDTRVTYNGPDNGYAAMDVNVTNAAALNLRFGDPDATFAYLGNIDDVGHSDGTGANYISAIETVDAQIRMMLDEIARRPTRAAEDWKVIVATDHGHKNPGGGHGGCDPNGERRTWILAKGAGHIAGLRPVDTRLTDVAGTVLAHFGVPVNPSWELDTRDLKTRSSDAFDTIAPQLNPRSHETAIPATVTGWTHQPPAGWTVNRDLMPPGGVNEWRGWSFTNEEFWTRTESGQNRENGLRLRGVFAVADSDEFADRSGGGSFDSTLVSPAFPVAPGGQAQLRFITHYLQQGSQRADVLVSFNGGPDQLLKRLTTDARATVVNFNLAVPANATSMVVKFRYYMASNHWYWAIDDLSVISCC